jgi:AcrR family transcriptional regulator
MVRNEETRKRIIEETAEIFNKKGYVGTYLSDLTAATGLTKGSIYGNFKDKEEVSLAAFQHNYNLIRSGFLHYLSKAHTASEQLLAFIDFYRAEHQRLFERGGCVLLNTAIDNDDGNPRLQAAARQGFLNWEKRISSIIEEGVTKKELVATNPTAFAQKMIALIEGSVMLARTMNDHAILLSNLDALENEIKMLKRN